ncbi:MAG: uncharacterized protein K0R27_105 [Xanthobacteraceae bacterium]|jgi:putative addiction module killer protein|nr:uncharacterized protein [Xanthobacteraceae bacterium]
MDHGLRDIRAKARIDTRILRLANGNPGDAKFFDGIGELRIDYGPGYRVYFVQRGSVLIVLLAGGDKSSQDRDITEAKRLARELKE